MPTDQDARLPALPENDDVWLIVPMFNEATVIFEVLQRLSETFPNIVCVDDGSTDGSPDVVAASPFARLVQHPVNLGQGAALQTGVEYARAQPRARFFVTFDADGQHQVDDALAMVERLRTEPLDILIATRFGDTEASGMPWLKRLVLRTSVALSPQSRRLGLTDTHNGLRAFDKVVADQLDLTVSGMGHASEFIRLIDRHGWRVAEHSATIIYTDYSKTKGQSLLNGVNIVVDGLAHGRSRR